MGLRVRFGWLDQGLNARGLSLWLWLSLQTPVDSAVWSEACSPGDKEWDLKFTYYFCAHMHEIVKYLLFTEIQEQCLNPVPATRSGPSRPTEIATTFKRRALATCTTRSAGSHISQIFDLLQFLSHQKILYKTCMCAVKVAMNFLVIVYRNCFPGFWARCDSDASTRSCTRSSTIFGTTMYSCTVLQLYGST